MTSPRACRLHQTFGAHALANDALQWSGVPLCPTCYAAVKAAQTKLEVQAAETGQPVPDGTKVLGVAMMAVIIDTRPDLQDAVTRWVEYAASGWAGASTAVLNLQRLHQAKIATLLELLDVIAAELRAPRPVLH